MQNSDLPVTKEGHGTQQAVQDYLDTLLQDATTQALAIPETDLLVTSEVTTQAVVESAVDTVVETTAETTAETTVETASTETVAADAITTSAEAASAEATSVETASPEATETSVPKEVSTAVVAKKDTTEAVATAADVEVEPNAQEWVDGRPAWAQSSFECLLFQVAGLTLAVPLVELGSVLNLDEELTPLFGQPEWFLGLLPSKTAGTVRVMDTAKKVMPEKYNQAARDDLKYVILMKNSDWGLACHEVAEAITLSPDEVRWRTGRGSRPWLAGTVIKHMCAIMDVASLVDLVNKDQLNIKAPQWTRQSAD